MDTLFNNIYQGKRVFITGHTGFKGSWLALWLIKLGAEVVGYSIDIPSQPSHFELLKLKLISITGDILDQTKLLHTIEQYQPDIVFHLAAQSLVRQSYVDPVTTFATNVMGTVNLLESCRAAGHVKAILNITSDKCYHNDESGKSYQETDALGGYDPYSASKGCAELVGNAYRKSFFNDSGTLLADVRAGNVIGGGDWAKDRLIPDLMQAISQGETVTIRNPQATRPWQHVLEPLSGYLQLGRKLLEGKKTLADNWNFGPDDQTALTVHEVVQKIQQQWPELRCTMKEDLNDYHEAQLLKLDSTKARTQLQWKNIWDSQATFEKTINWYQQYYKNGKVVSEDDLNDYVADARLAFVEWIN